MNVFAVPIQQVSAGDCRHRVVLGSARIRALCSVGQLSGLPSSDSTRVIIASRDGRVELLPGERKLVFAELGMLEQIGRNAEHTVKGFFQARPGKNGRISTAGG